MKTRIAAIVLALSTASSLAVTAQVAHRADERHAACLRADAIAERISVDARTHWSELQAIANLYGRTNGQPDAAAAEAVEAPIVAREKRLQAAQIEWAAARAACQS